MYFTLSCRHEGIGDADGEAHIWKDGNLGFRKKNLILSHVNVLWVCIFFFQKKIEHSSYAVLVTIV